MVSGASRPFSTWNHSRTARTRPAARHMDRRAGLQRNWGMRWCAALLVIVLVAGCGGDDKRAVVAKASSPAADRDFTFEVPDGWHLFPESQTPALTNPVEILSAGTVPPGSRDEGSCAHMPVAALERVGPRDAFVTVQERHGKPHFPDRPEPFTLPERSEGTDAEACARNGEQLDIHWFGFRDAGRGFHVLVAFGRDAPPERRAEAVALLESLRFESGPEGVRLDPDRAVRFEDDEAGLAWQMPVPPWRRYDGPLTSMHGERLLLGTFAVPSGPPDRNCTPRAAIDAMPPDGAFIYLYEYLDLGQEKRIPERTGEIALGPELPFGCMGESRKATWREQGRAFQAHVYMGPRSGDQLERDARSILNSIQVR
jgi:hypothetical protein